MQLIDGKAVAAAYKQMIKEEVQQMDQKPHLTAVLVGHDGGSETYVGHKEKMCAEVGFTSEVLRFEDTITQEELMAEIQRLNNDPKVNGFIIQLPLPSHIDEQTILEAVDPCKDVDGFHPVNVGRMLLGLPAYISATPLGIIELIQHYKIPTAGKHCVVIGRSNIVGRPVANLLSGKGFDCTITMCNSKTQNLKEICQQADILIAALGKPHFVKADMVKEGAVVIDVGTTRVKCEESKTGWKLTGDVDFDAVAPKSSYITPVPGGVGPMTIISLMQNTLKAAKGKVYKKR